MASHHAVLSHFQTRAILEAKIQGKQSAASSIDLGISPFEIILNADGVEFPGFGTLAWDRIKKIDSDANKCFIIENNEPQPIVGFSESTGRAFSLMPTAKAPALILAGFPMHRIKNTTPYEASAAMVAAIAPFRGEVLDTATGLGYTAIEAAKTASRVTTVELDKMSLETAKLNPWSRALFTDAKIDRIIGDCAEIIHTLPSDKFCGIIHDPPTLSLAGDLYSGEFYRQAFRTLRPGGKMFHYIGNPAGAAGSKTTRGVIRRLNDAGFKKVESVALAYGVRAFK